MHDKEVGALFQANRTSKSKKVINNKTKKVVQPVPGVTTVG